MPVYGDGRALDELAARLRQVLEPLAPWELILVNDGSPPPAWDRLRHLASSHPSIKAIDLQCNAGQHNALLAGIRASTGAVVITMDDDLQHPPEAIPALLQHLRESDDDVVYGTPREGVHGQRRQFGGRIARHVVALASGVPEARLVSAFRAFRGTLRTAFADELGSRVFIDGVLCRAPHKVGAVPVRHEPRRHGRSGYSVRRLMTVAATMTAAFGIPRARLALLIAAGALLVIVGITLWRGLPVVAGLAIASGGLLLAAAAGCLLLLATHSAAARRRGSSYAIRASVNLDLP